MQTQTNRYVHGSRLLAATGIQTGPRQAEIGMRPYQPAHSCQAPWYAATDACRSCRSSGSSWSCQLQIRLCKDICFAKGCFRIGGPYCVISIAACCGACRLHLDILTEPNRSGARFGRRVRIRGPRHIIKKRPKYSPAIESEKSVSEVSCPGIGREHGAWWLESPKPPRGT